MLLGEIVLGGVKPCFSIQYEFSWPFQHILFFWARQIRYTNRRVWWGFEPFYGHVPQFIIYYNMVLDIR